MAIPGALSLTTLSEMQFPAEGSDYTLINRQLHNILTLLDFNSGRNFDIFFKIKIGLKNLSHSLTRTSPLSTL